MTKKTDDQTLIKALRLLADDIISEDGVAVSVIKEAADRIEDQSRTLRHVEVVANYAVVRPECTN